jgi:hypothetical protein
MEGCIENLDGGWYFLFGSSLALLVLLLVPFLIPSPEYPKIV